MAHPGSQVVLATAGYDHTIRFWEATSGICYRTLQYADSQARPRAITVVKASKISALTEPISTPSTCSCSGEVVLLCWWRHRRSEWAKRRCLHSLLLQQKGERVQNCMLRHVKRLSCQRLAGRPRVLLYAQAAMSPANLVDIGDHRKLLDILLSTGSATRRSTSLR